MILLDLQAAEESSKKADVNSLFPGFMLAGWIGFRPIKFWGCNASCGGTGRRRHFLLQKSQTSQKKSQSQKRSQKSQTRKSRPYLSKRWEERRWEKRWEETRWEETR